MDNDVKRIFKNEMIGQPQLQKVLRNRIRGVNGEVVDITELPKGILTSITTNPIVELKYTKTIETTTNPLGDGSRIDRNYSAIGKFTPFDFTFDFAYSALVKDVTASAKFVYDHVSQSYDTLQGHNPQFVIDFVNSIYTGYAVSFQAGTDPFNGIIMPNWHPFSSNISRKEDVMQVTVEKISSFQIKVHAKLPVFTSYGSIYFLTEWGFAYVVQQPVWVNSYSVITQVPQYVELIVNGITYKITPTTFQIGEQTNAFKFPQNSLITTKSTKDGIPLYQFLSNKIINEWHDGKQITNLAKIINNNQDLEQKNTDVKIMNTREESFIDDSQSFSRHPDGTARVFKIDSADVVYDGSLRQTLDISEKI